MPMDSIIILLGQKGSREKMATVRMDFKKTVWLTKINGTIMT